MILHLLQDVLLNKPLSANLDSSGLDSQLALESPSLLAKCWSYRQPYVLPQLSHGFRGIQTLVLKLMQQTIYPPNHLPSLKPFFFFSFLFFF